MNQRFDTILKSGTVVNQDGEGIRDIGISNGRIAAIGFTIVDLKRSETITNKWIASRAGWTPYDGVTVTGWPVGTLLRGRRVMWDGELTQKSQGEPVRFLETLAQVR